MEKKELLGEIKEKTQSIIIKEFGGDGALVQYNSVGDMKGKIHANHIETVDSKLKVDGSLEWEVRAMQMTKEGDVLMISGKGTGRITKPMEGNFSGEATYMTNSSRLSWLNNSKVWVEGMNDLKNGELTIKLYQEAKATQAVAAPAM
jgi:hypothetical protein